MNWKIIGSSVSALVLFGALCVLSFFVGESRLAIVLNLSVLVFGTSLGWMVGIVVSPSSRKEQRQFTALSKAVTVFASGYLVGKLDKLMEKLFDPALVLESVHGFRLLAFTSAFALAMIFTFVFRQYAKVYSKPREHEEDDDGAPGIDPP